MIGCDAEEAHFIDLLNAYRAENGLGAGAARQRAGTYWIWYCHFRQED